MPYLRTAAGGLVNAAEIVRLSDQRGNLVERWVATCNDGREVALSRHFNAPGRIERDFPGLVAGVSEAGSMLLRHASTGHVFASRAGV